MSKMDRRGFLRDASLVALAAAGGELAGCVSFGACGTMSGFQAAPLKRIRLGFIGIGERGLAAVSRVTILPGVESAAFCDLRPERVDLAMKNVTERKLPGAKRRYEGREDSWKGLCDDPDVDVVYIVTPAGLHVEMELYAMRAGKHVLVEVPGAQAVDDCWAVVETCEATRRHCMMLENCCYGEMEMLAWELVHKGLLGTLTHAEGAYIHDLCWRHLENNFRNRRHFNGGTENAAAETDAKVHGLDFSRATDFSFGGSGLVSVGEGGLSAVNADTAAHAITISAPLKVDSHAQSWTLGGLTTLMLNGDLSSLFTTEPLTVTGDGAANEIVLAGDNAALVPSLEFTGVSKVTVKSNTGLGGGDSATFNNVIPHFVDCESNGVAITVSAIDHDDKEPFFSNDSGSFVMTAPFTISAKGISGSGYDARPYLHLENLDMTFAAGVTVGKCDRVFFNVSGARVHFKDSTIVKSGTGHIRLDGGVTTNSLIRIDRPMNLGSVKMVLYICRAAIVCGAPDIFASFDSNQQINMSASSMGADSDSRLGMIDLNGFDQSIGILSEDYVYLTKAQTSSSFRKSFFEITSATPATLTLTTFSGSRVLPYKFTGAASLDYNQSGTVIVSNAISTTCGELTVSKGTLIFAKDSGWGGGTNVTVKAGATLGATAEGMATVFACAAKPRRSTVSLELRSATADDVTSFGMLQLGEGTAKVNTLRFDGVYQPAGTYGSSASAATHKDDSRFSGPGVLEVRHSTPGPYGLTVIVK